MTSSQARPGLQGFDLRVWELAGGLEPPTCCLQDSSGSSTAYCPVCSLQLRSGGPSSQSAPVGPSSPRWNDNWNDVAPAGHPGSVVGGTVEWNGEHPHIEVRSNQTAAINPAASTTSSSHSQTRRPDQTRREGWSGRVEVSSGGICPRGGRSMVRVLAVRSDASWTLASRPCFDRRCRLHQRARPDAGATFRLRVGCSASTWMALDGSSLLTLDVLSVQAAQDGYRRIVWMIIGMIKAHPTKNRMPRQAKSTPPFGCGVVGQHASGGLALPGVVQPAGVRPTSSAHLPQPGPRKDRPSRRRWPGVRGSGRNDPAVRRNGCRSLSWLAGCWRPGLGGWWCARRSGRGSAPGGRAGG
jgi:hypothetical protein